MGRADKRRPARPVDREQALQFWAALPRELGGIEAEAARKADDELGRRRAKQLVDFWQLIEASCIAYARQLASGQVRITASDFVGLIKAALLLQGAPGSEPKDPTSVV
jgi:hypothetical protein